MFSLQSAVYKVRFCFSSLNTFEVQKLFLPVDGVDVLNSSTLFSHTTEHRTIIRGACMSEGFFNVLTDKTKNRYIKIHCIFPLSVIWC